jgi:hypothetical protein
MEGICGIQEKCQLRHEQAMPAQYERAGACAVRRHWGFACLIVDKLWDKRVERLFAVRRWSRAGSARAV